MPFSLSNVPPHASSFFRLLAIFFISMPFSKPVTWVTIFPYLFFTVATCILCSLFTICSHTQACFGKPHFGHISILTCFLTFPFLIWIFLVFFFFCLLF